jgi:hypothetical protein
MKIPYDKYDLLYIEEGLLTSSDELVVIGLAEDVRQDVVYSLLGQPATISKIEKKNVKKLSGFALDIKEQKDLLSLDDISVPLDVMKFNVLGIKGALLIEDSDNALFDVDKVFAYTQKVELIDDLVLFANEMNKVNSELEDQETMALDAISTHLKHLNTDEAPTQTMRK